MRLTSAALLLILLNWGSVVKSVEANQRPNIILMISDDQRLDTIGALGNPIIDTPNLDHLVHAGTAFTRAHAAHPLCHPSRAELLTGVNGFQNGIMPSVSNAFKKEVVMLPQLLGEAGYETWYVGKWHTTGRPSTRGYSDTLGLFTSGGGKYWKDQVDFKGMPVTGYRGWIFQTDDRQLFPEKGVGLTPDISEQFADAAIKFIQRKSTKPYFLHVNFTAPHDPLFLPTGYEDKYDPEEIPLPPNYAPEHPFDHGNFKGRDEEMLPWPRTKQAVKENLAVYYAVISHMDEQIGRILDALEHSGQLENSIVIFSSDHGLAVGSHGLMGKQNMYEHTVLVPMIMAGPGIQAGEKSDALCYIRDLYPTICKLAEVDTPEYLDTLSMLPVAQGKQTELHEQVYCYFSDKQRMVRDDRWKLIHYPEIDRYQLFDISQDPDELNDRSKAPAAQEKMNVMKAQLEDWLQSQTDEK